MKKILLGGALFVGIFVGMVYSADQVEAKEMQRLYNPNSGEHFYTDKILERNSLIIAGWNYEGIGWGAPDQGNPVYRLYNPNAGDHHYTTNGAEKNLLVAKGWKYEGIGWYSDNQQSVPLYRAYNPNAKAGSHNYTSNLVEQNKLVSLGWKNEGIGWYAKTNGYQRKLLTNVKEAADFMGQRFIQSGGASAFKNGIKNSNGSFTFEYQITATPNGIIWNTVTVNENGKILHDGYLKTENEYSSITVAQSKQWVRNYLIKVEKKDANMVNNQTVIFTSFDENGNLILNPRSDGPNSFSSLGFFKINEYGELEQENPSYGYWEVVSTTPDLN